MSKEHAAPSSQAKKRKGGQDGKRTSAEDNDRAHKRRRFDHSAKQRDARAIATQTSLKAFKHGELDIDKFVKSREYEIQALERGLVNSKKALMKRAFQMVPKDLRRRTASHNVQRVPKRLRARARKEMREDNTPTVTARKRKPNSHMRLRLETAKKLRSLSSIRSKSRSHPDPKAKGESSKTKPRIKSRPAKIKQPTLATVPVAKAKFRKRQRDKAWLPTHLFHAKRARMTPASEPLWRFALPITPTAKSYRAVHRVVSERGAMAWDTSYFSTAQLDGRRSSLNTLLKLLGVEDQLVRQRKQDVRGWLLGRRALSLDVYQRDHPSRHIAPATFVWSHKPSEDPAVAPDHQQSMLWIRVHPAAFLELWEELLRVSKIVKPHVTVTDIRYEVGSIEVVGPEATDALLAVLHPCKGPETSTSHEVTDKDDTFFKQLNGIHNTAILEAGTLISLEIDDPRLHFPPRSKHPSMKPHDSSALLETIAQQNSARRKTLLDIMDREKRTKASSKIPSQKSLDRRRRAAPPGQLPSRLESDSNVPVLLFTAPNEKSKRQQSKWTVLLPWKWVQIVWYCLMYSPLPSGAQPRFGGLDELRVCALEHGMPFFPADYPATNAGWTHELQTRSERQDAWQRRPKSKRVNWDRLAISATRKGEIGAGWACDWSRLLKQSDSKTAVPRSSQAVADQVPHLKHGLTVPWQPQTMDDDPQSADQASKLHGSQTQPGQDSWSALNMVQLSGTDAKRRLDDTQPLPISLKNALFTVRIEALPRGVAQVCARIYRLPSSSTARRRWLQQHPALATKPKASHDRLPNLPENAPLHEVQRELARSLLTPTLPGQDEYPDCPGEEDLIGFVTSGNYDLGAGKGVAIGNLSLRIVRSGWLTESSSVAGVDSRHLCIVRNSGQTIGRLAIWEVVV